MAYKALIVFQFLLYFCWISVYFTYIYPITDTFVTSMNYTLNLQAFTCHVAWTFVTIYLFKKVIHFLLQDTIINTLDLETLRDIVGYVLLPCNSLLRVSMFLRTISGVSRSSFSATARMSFVSANGSAFGLHIRSISSWSSARSQSATETNYVTHDRNFQTYRPTMLIVNIVNIYCLHCKVKLNCGTFNGFYEVWN